MGKKKSKSAMVPVATAVPAQVHAGLEQLVKQTPGASVASVVRDLITDHVTNPKPNAMEIEGVDEETLVRLLTHFEERLAERIVTLNYNLRQATGMIMTPKARPQGEAAEEYEINNSLDAKSWIESTFRDLTE